jgi:hypothetical protein
MAHVSNGRWKYEYLGLTREQRDPFCRNIAYLPWPVHRLFKNPGQSIFA